MPVAHQTHLVWVVVASTAERIVVVELEPSSFCAASTLVVHELALATVALAYKAPHRRWDVARLRRGIGLLEGFSRGLRLAISFRFKPFELLGHGSFDDRCQVGVHKRLESLELLAELPAGGELDLVPRGCQGLHHGWHRRGSRRL